ncbi:hypothetical protein [Streptomyces fuscigenes]|uniref:hypothetical protein n=1 Tax=Streptomyces fuscigenes TaxID=1528880 RepID=UPI001F2475C9|nr:hypothetical protein [Streptomyces fuscigenes]MCF3960298.1 hypothetical protein [Streptomyces fuscigenes]
MRAAFKIMGTTDLFTDCECCHRTHLRSTVALQPLDQDGSPDGELTYYGTGCAATAMGWSSYRVRKAARYANYEAAIARRTELRDGARSALPRLREFRAVLLRRMEAGEDPATVAAAHANRLGTAMWRYDPARRAEAEDAARGSFATGGLAAVLATYDRYLTEMTRMSVVDPTAVTY